MKKIIQYWHQLQHIGVQSGMSSGEIRYIKTINGLVVFVTFLLWLQLPFVIDLLPTTQYILFTFLSWPFLIMLILYLNKHHYYTCARFSYSLFTLFTIFTVAIQLGPETANHLFMAAAILGFFVIFPKQQRWQLIAMVSLAIIGFVVLEWFFHTNGGGLLDLPPDFIWIAKLSSMSAFIFIILAITAYHYNLVHQAELNLENEHRRSENLLLNILPEHIADRLKDSTTQIADQIDEAGVLFADIVGFTELSAQVHHKQLVSILDNIFSTFDEHVEKYGLEKIKMIGDAYMVGSGLHDNKSGHLYDLGHCALKMLGSIDEYNKKQNTKLGVRIGIHTGPVVAGVICKKKFAYDLWGDAVNTASRMESHGMCNKIHVSKAFFDKTKHAYKFEERGLIKVKGKGEMETFFLLHQA